MKNIANYISLSRIFLSILLIFTQPLSPTFFIVYSLCGLSDVIDGYVARKMGLVNDFGAKLDSYADIIFILSYLTVLLPILRLENDTILWMIIIFVIRITTIIIGYMKFGKFSSVHTNLNKLTGTLLFIFPFSLAFSISYELLTLILIISTLASLEELLIICSSKNINPNRKSYYSLKVKQ